MFQLLQIERSDIGKSLVKNGIADKTIENINVGYQSHGAAFLVSAFGNAIDINCERTDFFRKVEIDKFYSWDE